MNIEAMAAEARGRLHMMIDAMALHSGDDLAFRAVIAAHRHALAGGSFARSLAQQMRRIKERRSRSGTAGMSLG